MWLSGSCMRTERGESSQWHFSKELCVNSKPKPRKASKQDGVTENTQYSQICVVCLNYQSVASGPHRFFVRDYSFDLEEQKQREIMQLSFHKKEQYVSQTLHTLSEGFFFYVLLMRFSLSQGIFVRWLKVNFSEVFVAWIHLKALRVFVESVLRSAPVDSDDFFFVKKARDWFMWWYCLSGMGYLWIIRLFYCRLTGSTRRNSKKNSLHCLCIWTPPPALLM